MSEAPVHGKPPEEQDTFWLDLMREAQKNSAKTLDESAKQLIAVPPILSGLYTAALSFAKIKTTYWQAHPVAPYVFVAPIFMMALSLICAVVSLYPQPYLYNPYDPAEVRTKYTARLKSRHTWLTVGLVFLILSLFALLAAVWLYLDALAAGQVSLGS